MKIHPLLIKCPVTTQGKIHRLFFEREQREHMQKSHPLLIETVVTTYGSSFTAY